MQSKNPKAWSGLCGRFQLWGFPISGRSSGFQRSLRFQASLQSLIAEVLFGPDQEGDCGDGSGQNICNGLRYKDAEQFIGTEQRQNVDQGDEQDDLPQQGQKKGDLGLSQSQEGLLQSALSAKGKTARKEKCG